MISFVGDANDTHGVIKDIFPGGRSVAGIPKVGGVASGVPAFPHTDVHQVDPEEADKEGEQEDEEGRQRRTKRETSQRKTRSKSSSSGEQ